MIPRAMPVETPVPSRFSHAGLVTGKRPDKGWPSRLGVGYWTNHPIPKKSVLLIVSCSVKREETLQWTSIPYKGE